MKGIRIIHGHGQRSEALTMGNHEANIKILVTGHSVRDIDCDVVKLMKL